MTTHLRLTHLVDMGFDHFSSGSHPTSSQTELLDQNFGKKVDIGLHKTTKEKAAKENVTSEIKKSLAQQKITVCPISHELISGGTAKKEHLPKPSCWLQGQESKQSEAGITSSLTLQSLMNTCSLSILGQSITAIPPTSQGETFGKRGIPGLENQSALNSQEMILSCDRHIFLDHNNTYSKQSSSNISETLNVDISEGNLKFFSKKVDKFDHSDVIKSSSNSIQMADNSPNGNKCGNYILSNNIKPSDKESTRPALTDFYFLLGTVSIQGNSMTYERTEFRCLHCKFSTAWRPSLVKHMKGVHKEILDIHSVLEMRNVKSADKVHEGSNLINQKSNYRVLKMSEYIISQKRTKNRPHRPRKLNYQDLPGRYPCLICHKVFTRLRYLRRHHIVHRGERSHQCDLCGKCFKTRAALGSHRCSNLVDKQKTYFHCPQCSFTSNSRTAVHKHRQLHPCGAMLCHVCGAAYPDRSTLRRHIRVHDPSRPFACGHIGCTWRFKTEVMCRAHERGHNLSHSASKFQCTFCGYNFRQKHHLQRHVAKFHSVTDDGASGKKVSFSTTLPLLSSPTTSPATLFPHPKQSLTLSHITTGHRMVSVDVAEDIGKVFSQSDQRQSTLVICIDNRDTHHISSPTPLPALSSVEGSSNNLQRSDHSYLADHCHSHEVFLASHPSSVKQEDTVQAQSDSLEIIHEECDLVDLLKSGILMARDQHGNVVHYKVADVGSADSQDISTASTGQQLAHNSAPVYFIDVGNSY